MRVLELVLAGVLALSVPIVAHSDPPGPKARQAGPVPGVPQLRGAGGSSRQPVSDGRGASKQPMPVHPSQWIDGARPHWAPNRYYGVWGPPAVWGGPYAVWGGPYLPYCNCPYVPYRNYGDWGALWYPYAEWREPHGGWGNP